MTTSNTLSQPDTRKWLLPWVVAIAMFMETLDSTIVGVAIPHIAASFQINPVDLKLALTSYLLSLAIFIPISGWLADRYGERNMFIMAMIIFTCSSVLCGLSFNLPMLVAARLLQGFGGALMMPVGRLIMLRTFPKEEFGRAMGMVVIPGLVGPALGPTIGGLILHVTSWHWIFFVNIPFGIAGIIITAIFMLAPPQRTTRIPFNWPGFLLFSFGLAFITVGMAMLGDNFDLLNPALICTVIAALLLFIYWRVSSKQAHPLLEVDLFKEKTFAVSMAVNFLMRIGTGAIPFLLPLLLQLVWGRSALFSGVLFIFWALGMMSTRFILNQKALVYYGFKRVLMVSTVLLTLFSMNLCWFDHPLAPPLLAGMLFIIGALTSQIYMSLGTLYPLELHPTKYSQATSIASTIQQFSAGCGVAAAAITLHLISKITQQPLFSSDVFFWTFIGLNSVGILSVFFIMQLNPALKLGQVPPT